MEALQACQELKGQTIVLQRDCHLFVESQFVEALYLAIENEKEPTDLDTAQVLTELVPLSKTMSEQISGLRNWAKGRARRAATAVEDPQLRQITI